MWSGWRWGENPFWSPFQTSYVNLGDIILGQMDGETRGIAIEMMNARGERERERGRWKKLKWKKRGRAKKENGKDRHEKWMTMQTKIESESISRYICYEWTYKAFSLLPLDYYHPTISIGCVGCPRFCLITFRTIYPNRVSTENDIRTCVHIVNIDIYVLIPIAVYDKRNRTRKRVREREKNCIH